MWLPACACDHAVKVVQGYQPMMPQLNLSDEQIDAIIAYIKTLR